MAVPTFQTWFVPLLKRVSDGKVHTLSELYAHLADDLQLSEADRAETLANGKTRLFRNRIAWARTYLQKAGLVNAPGRAQCQITERGLKALAQNPDGLKVKYLKQFPEFREFHTYKKPKGDAVKPAAEDDDANGSTPEELLSQSHLALKESVTQELLERLKTVDPTYFESIVLDLLLKMGYGGSREDAGMTLGGSGDGGLDGVINEDRLGLDVVYIQAKRWENTVQRPTVQAFAGSLVNGHRT